MILPRFMLIFSGILVGIALLAASIGSVRGTDPGSDLPDRGRPAVVRDLRFTDRADGGVDVREAASGRQVATLPPGGEGFIRGTLRGLTRERTRRSVAHDLPFRLEGWDDGAVVLEDSSTDSRIELRSFGPDNVEAFRKLLLAGR